MDLLSLDEVCRYDWWVLINIPQQTMDFYDQIKVCQEP